MPIAFTVLQILMNVSALSVALTLIAPTHLARISAHVSWATHQLSRTRNPATPTSVLVFELMLFRCNLLIATWCNTSQESCTKLSEFIVSVVRLAFLQMLMSVSKMRPYAVLMPTAQIQSDLTFAPAFLVID